MATRSEPRSIQEWNGCGKTEQTKVGKMKNLNFPGLPRVLIVDSEESIRESLRSILHAEGIAVETATTVEDGVRRVGQKGFDVVFVDSHLAGDDGVSILRMLRRGVPAAEAVILASHGVVTNTVGAMRAGAADVVDKPYSRDRILSVVRRLLETRQLKSELNGLQDRVRELTATELVGLSPAIRDVQTRIDQMAHAPDAPVLVTGGSGTGKELVARCIHERSSRRQGPFAAINCAALPENSLEAELFGSEPGAFVGASHEGKQGLFATASGGTLFLDEIGGMAKPLQAKLLRAVQDRTFRKVGGAQDIHADVRVVASTSRDLRSEVGQGNFREDLFHRLNATTVGLPLLSERAEDIPLLSHFFLGQFGRQMGKALTGFTEGATEILCEHSWPGNVRELKNAIEHASMICPSGMIDECHLPRFTGGALDGSDEIARGSLQLEMGDRSIRQLEGKLVACVLDDTKWNISKAAAILGINRTTLYNKIRLHGLGERPSRRVVAVP